MSEIKNLQGSINLKKLQNVQLLKVTVNGESHTCVCIPLKGNDLHFHKNGGIFLGLSVIEAQNIQFENTHYIKQNHSKEFNESITDEQRHVQPILGNMRPMNFTSTPLPPSPTANTETIEPNEIEGDLPF